MVSNEKPHSNIWLAVIAVLLIIAAGLCIFLVVYLNTEPDVENDPENFVVDDITYAYTPAVTETTTAMPEIPVLNTGASVYTRYDPAITGQEINFIYVYGNTAYEYYNYVASTAEKYAGAVNSAAAELKNHGIAVYDMVVPTSIGVVLDQRVADTLPVSDQRSSIARIYGFMGQDVKTVPVFDVLKARCNEYLYFRTDHHWTALGAYYTYAAFMQSKGIAAHPLTDFEERAYTGFLGSFYRDTDHCETLGNEPDTLFTYTPRCNYSFAVQSAGSQSLASRPLVADASDYSAGNKYLSFIGGDNPLSVLENDDISSGKSCIVVKESFGNAFIPFLAYDYKYVYVIDYRHFDGDITDYAVSHNVDELIIQSNISMTRNAKLVALLAEKL